MEKVPLQISDFSGGLTDFFIGTSPSELQKALNFGITVDKKLLVRPGSLAEGSTDTFAQMPSNFPVSALLENLTGSGLPYKVSNTTEVVDADRRGRLYHHTGATHVELVGPVDSNSLFTNAHAGASSASKNIISSKYNDQYYITSESFTQKPQKLYVDGSNALQLRTAGLPKPAGVTLSGAGYVAGVGILYAYGYKYTYTSGGRTYIDRGPLQRFKADGVTPNSSTTGASTITNLPVLANGATDNYDTANIKVEVYRTTLNGRIYYLLGEVTNGTTTFNVPAAYDVAAEDAVLATQPVHYTTSGQPDFDPPPMAKYVHVTERGIGLYGYIQDGGDTIKNGFVQSITGAPDKVPAVFNGIVDEELTGLSSYKGVPLFFTTKFVYRGEGQYTATGTGALLARKIADSVGCISHNSIVQAPDGVFFASDTGFYWTNGFQVTPVSEKIRDTYARVYAGVQVGSISGVYDATEKLVMWTFPDTTTSDGIFVLHTRLGVASGGSFTTWGGDTNFTPVESGVYPTTIPTTITQNFKAKCLLAFNDTIYRGDERGYAFYFDRDTKSDPRVVATDDISLWGTTAITYDARLVALNFGTNFVRKLTNQVVATLKNEGNLSLRIASDRDLENRPKYCREIKKVTDFNWGDAGVIWGDEVMYTSNVAMYEEIRTLPTPGLRCSYRSLWFQNAFTIINKSDNLGTADSIHNPTYGILTLNDASSSWPTDILDLYISFPNAQGEYEFKFLITERTATTIRFEDPANIIPSLTATAWQLMGIAKRQIAHINSLVIPFSLLKTTQNTYATGDEGGNA